MRLLKISAVLAIFSAVSLWSAPAQATILVGTFNNSNQGVANGDSSVNKPASNNSINVANINELIRIYNLSNSVLPSLDLDASYLGKVEAPNISTFLPGSSLEAGDFSWYKENSTSPDFTQTIFGTEVGFSAEGGGSEDKVRGFIQTDGDLTFNYYVAKNGDMGWSLWHTGGATGVFHPVYIDDGSTIGDSSTLSSGYTPVDRDVSNVTFWQAVTPTVPIDPSDDPPTQIVPEPSSLALLGIGLCSLLGYGYRRRRAV